MGHTTPTTGITHYCGSVALDIAITIAGGWLSLSLCLRFSKSNALSVTGNLYSMLIILSLPDPPVYTNAPHTNTAPARP